MSNLGFMNGREENWDSRSRLQNTSAQKCVNEERQDRSREKKKKKKHAALIRNAGGVLPVQSQRRKQAERHRRAFCIVSFPLPFFAWNQPPIGGQLTTSSFVLSHFSLSLSLEVVSPDPERECDDRLVSLYIARLGRWWSRAKRRTSAKAQKRVSSGSQICVKADATFILFFSSLGLCFYTQKNTCIIGVGEIVRHRGFRQENGLDESVREVRKHDGRVSGGGNHG